MHLPTFLSSFLLSFPLSKNRRAFLAGTLLLTGTGFLCRVLGFFYRIFLSRTIGAEGLGQFNLIHPIYGICFALCAGSMQTALSQYIAANRQRGRRILTTGLILSLAMAATLAFLICRYADWLASYILLEPRLAPLLPLMGLSVPFAAVHSCINGYYYGMQRPQVPAFSQVTEQLIRMSLVSLLAFTALAQRHILTVRLAVIGHLIGEVGAFLFNALCLRLAPSQNSISKAGSDEGSGANSEASSEADNVHVLIDLFAAQPLMALALPLMGSRLVLNLLGAAEAVWIPGSLRLFGLSDNEAFAVYGVLSGMALPFILFPSAITNSMAVLLLPNVAQVQAEGCRSSIAASISISLRYSLYMGIFCIGIFTEFGMELGLGVFRDTQAGQFIQVLAWLCPFLYLATTMGSILNGLGRTRTTFLQNTAALLLRIGFVVFGIPRCGIHACLIGMLASELLLALLHLHSLKHLVPFTWNAWDMLVKPALLLIISLGIHRFFAVLLPLPAWLPLFIRASLQILFVGCCYGGLLGLMHIYF